MKLNYVATNIANAERDCKMKFFTVLGSFGSEEGEENDATKINLGVSELVFLCKAGGASDEEINEAFKTGFDNVLVAIVEGLNTAGFFGELKIDTAEIKNAMKKAFPVSQNTGKAAKN